MRRFVPLLLALLALGASAAGADELADAVRLLDEGWGGRAEARLAAIAAREPDRAEVWYRLAWARFRSGDFAEAEEHAARAVELDPGNPDYLVLRGHAAGRRALTGSRFKALGRARTCRESYEAALALDPGHVEARVSLVRFLAEAPGIAGGDRDRARDLAASLEEVDPVEGRIMLGLVHARSGETDAALAAYREAVDLARKAGRKRDRALGIYLDACYRYARPDDALAALEEEAAIPGRGVAARTRLALHFQRTGDPGGARVRWEALAAVDSTRFAGLMGLGSLETERGGWTAAAALYDSAYAAAPDRRQALYQASRARLLGDFELDRAVAGLREYLAAEINLAWPPEGWARVRLAEALCRTGDPQAARTQLARLRDLPVHDENLRKRVEELEESLEDDWGG